jgi:AcrR family transcriptional regulator
MAFLQFLTLIYCIKDGKQIRPFVLYLDYDDRSCYCQAMSFASSSITSSEGGESRRLKGQSSRTTILLTAAKLATTKGLAGLSIGDLASEVGMSKSGLYAHFKSKEELELATIETAAVIFDSEVLQPALRAHAGTERLKALASSFLSHIERRVFPGGCFFSAVAAELDTRPGPARDRVVEVLGNWLALLRQCILEAQDLGEIDPHTEVAQAVFEIEAMLLAGNFLFVMMDDPIHLTQARRGVENVLGRLAVTESKKK